MKLLFYLSCIILISSCSSPKGVYWCGDHPCINKAERENYFKNHMIVEFKSLKNGNLKQNSEIDKIVNQVELNQNNQTKEEKIILKKAKLDEKNLIKERKALFKKAKLDEKNRILEEKELAKRIELDEKNIINKSKESVISDKKFVENQSVGINEPKITLSDFEKKIKNIKERNSIKPYPDINITGN